MCMYLKVLTDTEKILEVVIVETHSKRKKEREAKKKLREWKERSTDSTSLNVQFGIRLSTAKWHFLSQIRVWFEELTLFVF